MEEKRCVFNIKGKVYEVFHSQGKNVRWKPKLPSKADERSVQLRYVITTEISGDREWIMHFAERKKKVLTVQNVTFSHQDSAVCQQWVTSINEALEHLDDQKRSKKLLVFINPRSGWHKGVQIYDKQIKPLFALAGVQTDVIVTEDANHAGKVLAEYDLASIDGIASAGGDGTLMQVVNGLQQRLMKEAGKNVDSLDGSLATTDLRIGVLAAGTGQGMLDTFTGSKDVITSALTIILGEDLAMDLMSVHNGGKLMGYTSLMTCTGCLADVAFEAESYRSLGPLRYLFTMLKGMVSSRKHDAEIHYLDEGDRDQTSETAAAQNWKVIQGRFVTVFFALLKIFNPSAGEIVESRQLAYIKNTDIYICTVNERCGRLQFLKWLMALSRGEGQMVDGVIELFKSKAIKLVLPPSEGDDRPRYLNLDGEAFQVTHPEVHLRFHPAVMRAFCVTPECDVQPQPSQ